MLRAKMMLRPHRRPGTCAGLRGSRLPPFGPSRSLPASQGFVPEHKPVRSLHHPPTVPGLTVSPKSRPLPMAPAPPSTEGGARPPRLCSGSALSNSIAYGSCARWPNTLRFQSPLQTSSLSCPIQKASVIPPNPPGPGSVRVLTE